MRKLRALAYTHSEKGKIEVPTSGGVAGRMEWCDLSGRQRPRGGKMNVLYKKRDFFAQKFELLLQNKRKSS